MEKKEKEFKDWDQWLNVHRLENKFNSELRDFTEKYICEEISNLIDQLAVIDPTNKEWYSRESLVDFMNPSEIRTRFDYKHWLDVWSKVLNVDKLRYILEAKEHITSGPSTCYTGDTSHLAHIIN